MNFPTHLTRFFIRSLVTRIRNKNVNCPWKKEFLRFFHNGNFLGICKWRQVVYKPKALDRRVREQHSHFV